jgi:hypothetical protein
LKLNRVRKRAAGLPAEEGRVRRGNFIFVLTTAVVLAATPFPAPAQDAPAERPNFDHIPSVYTRTIRSPEPHEDVDWEARVTELLREEPGDVIVTAVGDMIFNVQISNRPEPERRQLVRLIQEADIAYGNLEFSMNRRPDLQRPFYNFRADPEFA